MEELAPPGGCDSGGGLVDAGGDDPGHGSQVQWGCAWGGGGEDDERCAGVVAVLLGSVCLVESGY